MYHADILGREATTEELIRSSTFIFYHFFFFAMGKMLAACSGDFECSGAYLLTAFKPHLASVLTEGAKNFLRK